MQITDKQWKESQIKYTVDRGTGELAYLLGQMSTKEVSNLRSQAGVVMWRWWHMEKNELITPAHLGEQIATEEGWPMGGMFYPTLNITNEGAVQIKLDYLSLPEMPIMQDALHKNSYYKLGRKYEELIDELIIDGHWMMESDMGSCIANCRTLIEHQTDKWYVNDQVVQTCFTKGEWRKFWIAQLKLAGKYEGLSTDILLDNYTEKVRKTMPGFGLNSDELARIDEGRKMTEREKMKWRGQFIFWVQFGYYLNYPLTSYAGLLSPLFIDRKMFEEDMRTAATKGEVEINPMFGPCTNLALSEFGKLVIMSYQNSKKEIMV